MILILPEINLKSGFCEDRIRGEEGTENIYSTFSTYPYNMSCLLRRENAKSLVINDLDSFDGVDNSDNITSILKIIESVDIPINVYSNFKNKDQCRYMLNKGIHRIIIDNLVFTNGSDVIDLIDEFTNHRIIFRTKTKDRKILINDKITDIYDIDYLEIIKTFGASRIIYSNSSWTTGDEPDIKNTLIEICEMSGLRVSVANVVYNAKQLWALDAMFKYGIDSLVIGSALYNNSFPCQRIWRLIEAELELDKSLSKSQILSR